MYVSDILSIISNKTLLSIEVLPSSHLKKDLCLEDIDLLYIINTIERKYNIVIPDAQISELSVVQDVIDTAISLL
jgi:acyl carrier protein